MVDVLYFKFDVNDDSKVFYVGLDMGLIINVVVDVNKIVIFYNGGWGEGFVSFSCFCLVEIKVVGLNVKWWSLLVLILIFDVVVLKVMDCNGGNQNWFEVNLNVDGFNVVNLKYQLGLNNLFMYFNFGNIYDISCVVVVGLVWEGQGVDDKVCQVSYIGKYMFDWDLMKLLDFGFNYFDCEKICFIYMILGLWGLYIGIFVLQGMFFIVVNFINFMGLGMFSLFFLIFDVVVLQFYLLMSVVIDKISDLVVMCDYFVKYGNGFGVELVLGVSGLVWEKIMGGFVQVNFLGDWGEWIWFVNVGLCYVSMWIVFSGVGQEILCIDLLLLGQMGECIIVLSDFVLFMLWGFYREWLFSLNFKVDVIDNLLFQSFVVKMMIWVMLSDLFVVCMINVWYVE